MTRGGAPSDPTPGFVPLPEWREYPPAEMLQRADAFLAEVNRRRTVREFSERPVPDGVIERCVLAAGTAPSGAHRQPWHFVVITDPSLKQRIRAAAEEEERDFYEHRAPPEWLEALAPLGTGPDKEFLETAPVLIAIFGRGYEVRADGDKTKNYYVTESVGIATGIFITALHHAGLATLTHTPSPMTFLSRLLERPAGERPFLLLVAGYPSPSATVPDLGRKSLADIMTRR